MNSFPCRPDQAILRKTDSGEPQQGESSCCSFSVDGGSLWSRDGHTALGSGANGIPRTIDGNREEPIRSATSHLKPASEVFMSKPPAYEPKQSYDEVIATSLKTLSIQDREKAYEDVHGVVEDVKETEEFMNQKLKELEDCLNNIPNKPAYDLAVHRNRSYVYDRSFQVKFLRSEEYRIMDTAKRMVRYFATKLDLWGADKLAQDITLASFSDVAKTNLLDGGDLQLLPVRDTSGRAIIFSFEKYHRQMYKTNAPEVYLARAYWYFLMSTLHDEETQKKGVVYVVYALDFEPAMDEPERKVFWNCCAVLNALPLRIASIHYCADDHHPALKPIISLVSLGMQHSVRCRMRMHYGTHQEVKYSLMPYGLPVKHFPVTHKGEWKINLLGKFWNHFIQKERDPVRYENTTLVPKQIDVLSGRGKPSQTHYGNGKFHELLVTEYDEYDAASRKDKNAIARRILDTMRSARARFLKKDENDVWVELTDHEAKNKVTHAFRRHREVQKLPGQLKSDRRPDREDIRDKEAAKRPKVADHGG